MLARSGVVCQIPQWRRDLVGAFTRPSELLGYLGLDPAALPTVANDAAADFPFLVPRAFAAQMRRGDPDDPLLSQVLPRREELAPCPGFGEDPVGDGAAQCAPGLLRKYPGRALLIATGACAIHCRYCFRRHYPYPRATAGRDATAAALAAIAADPSIEEVILSGGDPLLLDERRLTRLVNALEAIPHLRRLRLHTRAPVVLPNRVDGPLCRLLATTRLRPLVVIQANHAHELGEAARAALAALREAGVQLLNQSVLLRGVNDETERLIALSEALFECGVLPYYLHLLDRVRGAAHFEVDTGRAGHLLAEVRARLPGYLVPRLVREEVGRPSKTPIA
ncbi:EF-P beta-lysylation protein EpmB [Thiococcus pfennigii]|uniref:EF-P beta-lysylation protein EpmB n=1 Tax=Thiococcus pfennigii TaxID=1057 RepID=UPI0019068924|nr:EF-P beta-lysylation protein EpmB [Thiococcus pfennigii]MBK1701728.1 EF-P beta-lysylation protein EpmB [Thiococcus pfennigii]MBK1732457.1 EF-P beta-lysylation protein EpmB [Thiococcus pfennigii]